MKKVFTLTLGLAAMMSAVSASAENYTITTTAELSAALTAAREPDQVDTLFIKPAAADYNLGTVNFNKTITQRGTVVIYGVLNEQGERPKWRSDIQFGDNTAADKFSFIVENMWISYRSDATASSGQIFYVNGFTAFFDNFILKNCEIADYPRTIYRSVPKNRNTPEVAFGEIGRFEISDCEIHHANLTGKGNVWACVVMGNQCAEIVFNNNTFYDLPQNKQIFAYQYLNEVAEAAIDNLDVNFQFTNNDVFLATDQTNPFIDITNNAGQMSTYNISNNIFLRPTWEDETTNPRPTQTKVDEETGESTTTERQQQILRVSYGSVTAKNNVIDETFRESSANGWEKDVYLDADGEGAWNNGFDDVEPGILPEDAELSWDDMPFAEEGNFIRLNTLKIATLGKVVEDGELTDEAGPVGNPNQLVASMPTKTTLSIKVEGSTTATYTAAPAGPYFVGDEVTITLNLNNSAYREFNQFEGWEDGSTDLVRTVTLGAENNIVAKVKALPVFVAFDFRTASGNANSEYAADIVADGVTARAYVQAYDTVGLGAGTTVAPFALHTTLEEGYLFQARQGKFGEEDASKQMGVISRRTPYVAIDAGQAPLGAIIEFSTTGATDLSFSAYVGTDNNGYKTQKAYYSLDGEDWTEFASVELEPHAVTFSNGDGNLWGWTELKGNLPAAVEGKDKVYIKIQGDETSERVFINEATAATSDMFEYVGNVLISTASSSSIETLRGDAERAAVTVYDLTGRRVAAPQAGQLYIQGNKRFIQK